MTNFAAKSNKFIMIVFPNIKINLGLNVTSKRSDGYHNIETVFYPAPLYDVLEMVPSASGATTFTQTGIPIAGDPQQNLVMKAYRLLKAHYSVPELDIYLRKNIPFGAGLGGGSADAAFLLKAVNEWAGLQIHDAELEHYASLLGADCPFFIQNRPVFAEGVGTIFTPVSLSLAGYHLMIVKPDVSISTAEAYRSIRPQTPLESIRDIILCPIETWKNRLINDFEAGVFARFPETGRIKQRLYERGAVFAGLSGSGSAIFGLFKTGERLPETDFPNASLFYCGVMPTFAGDGADQRFTL
jgi:4-diphosphocytidyl-2-C-methyl-D-erythritol kinase